MTLPPLPPTTQPPPGPPAKPPTAPAALEPTPGLLPDGWRGNIDSGTAVAVAGLVALGLLHLTPVGGAADLASVAWEFGAVALGGLGLIAIDEGAKKLRGPGQRELQAAAGLHAHAVGPLVGLPIRPLRSRRLGDALCRVQAMGGAAGCARLGAASRRYAEAGEAAGSLAEAMAVASGRLARALRAGRRPAQAQAFQMALVKAYAGELAVAWAAQERAGRALAREMRRTGTDLAVPPADAARAAEQVLAPGKLPATAVARLRRAGLGPAALRRALLDGLSRLGDAPVSLRDLVSQPLPGAGYAALHRSVTPAEVAALVDALAANGVLRAGVRTRLRSHLLQAARGATARARVAAARRFLADVGVDVPGRYGELVRVAAEPLAGIR
jgi:hypothetical protein